MVHLQLHQLMGFHAKNDMKNMLVTYAQYDIHEKVKTLTEFARSHPKLRFYSADDLYQAANKQTKTQKKKKGSTTTVTPDRKKAENTKRAAKGIIRKIRQLRRLDSPKLDKTWDESYNTQSSIMTIPKDDKDPIIGSIFNVRMDKTEHKETHSILILMMMAKLIQYPAEDMKKFVSGSKFKQLMYRIEDLLEENILYGLSMEDAIDKILNDKHENHRAGLREYFTNMQVSLKIKLSGLDRSQKAMFVKYLTDERITDAAHISRMIGYIGEQNKGVFVKLKGTRLTSMFKDANDGAEIEKDSGRYDDIDPKDKENSKKLFGSFAFVERGRHIKLNDMQSNVKYIREFFSYDPKEALVDVSLNIESHASAEVEIKNAIITTIKRSILKVITGTNKEVARLKSIDVIGTPVNFDLDDAIKKDMRFNLDTTNTIPPSVLKIGYNKTTDDILLDVLKDPSVRLSLEIIMSKMIKELDTSDMSDYINKLISNEDIVSTTNANIETDTTPGSFNPEIEYDLDKLTISVKDWVISYMQSIPVEILPTVNQVTIADNITPMIVTQIIKSLYLNIHNNRTKIYQPSTLAPGSTYSSDDIDDRVKHFAETTGKTHTQTLFLHGADILVLYNVYQMNIESVSTLAKHTFKTDRKSMTKVLKDERFLTAIGLNNTNLYVIVDGNVFHRSYNINKFTVRTITLAKMKQQADTFTEINKKQNTKEALNGNNRRQ